MSFKSRHTEDLRKGRISKAGVCYFLTWCTAHRAPLLADDHNQAIARLSLAALDSAGDGRLLAGTVMPDHIHLLLALGNRITISQVVAKTKASITRVSGRMAWQLNFFEHRLRDFGSAENFAFYIFMNPYCAGLCRLEEIWPGWIPSSHMRWRFEEKTRNGRLPQPEWIAEAQQFGNALPDGADY